MQNGQHPHARRAIDERISGGDWLARTVTAAVIERRGQCRSGGLVGGERSDLLESSRAGGSARACARL